MTVNKILVALLSALLPAAAPAAEDGFSWSKDATAVALSKGGKDVWRFHYSTNDTKPFFHPVALPGGQPLTWQSPPDHVWHYGLWFSWKYINKVNYWEMDKTGACEGVTSWSDVKIETRPDFSATIEMMFDYRKRGAAAPAMTEKRTIAISAPAADGSYAMDWTQEFKVGAEDLKLDRTPPAKQPDGSAAGGYAGLSCRFGKDLKDAKVTATADIGNLKNSRYGFAATAADFNGVVGGGEAGLAMLNHPSNPRAPTRWYAIADPKLPFWFLNASLLQLEPMDVPAGKTMTLRYRVIVHPGRWDAAKLNAAVEAYTRSK